MTNHPALIRFIDNGGRRSGVDRRQNSYAGHIPERRSGFDRRSGVEDRRSGVNRRTILEEILNNLTNDQKEYQ